jgi:hypothetical protein
MHQSPMNASKCTTFQETCVILNLTKRIKGPTWLNHMPQQMNLKSYTWYSEGTKYEQQIRQQQYRSRNDRRSEIKGCASYSTCIAIAGHHWLLQDLRMPSQRNHHEKIHRKRTWRKERNGRTEGREEGPAYLHAWSAPSPVATSTPQFSTTGGCRARCWPPKQGQPCLEELWRWSTRAKVVSPSRSYPHFLGTVRIMCLSYARE